MGHLNAEDYILMESTTVNPTVNMTGRRNHPCKDTGARKRRVSLGSSSGFYALLSVFKDSDGKEARERGAKRLPGYLGLTKPVTGRKIPNKRVTRVEWCARKAAKTQNPR